MTDTPEYTPPKVWSWNKPSGGRFENINRPIAGPTHEKELPVGRHPLQLYSLGTPGERAPGQSYPPGEFWGPVGITADANGRVYVADTQNNRVQILEETGGDGTAPTTMAAHTSDTITL